MTKSDYMKQWREKNKDYTKDSNRDYYLQHKERLVKESIERHKRNKIIFNKYKSTLSCALCGYNKNTNILHFHHKDPKEKEYEPAQLAKYGLTDKVLKELEKCIVLCPNCHMDLHDKEYGTDYRYQE